jgi:hypothetical protein
MVITATKKGFAKFLLVDTYLYGILPTFLLMVMKEPQTSYGNVALSFPEEA